MTTSTTGDENSQISQVMEFKCARYCTIARLRGYVIPFLNYHIFYSALTSAGTMVLTKKKTRKTTRKKNLDEKMLSPLQPI